MLQGLHKKPLVMNIASAVNEKPTPATSFVNIHSQVRSRLRNSRGCLTFCCCFTCSHLRSGALKEIKTFLSVFIDEHSTRQGWQKDCVPKIVLAQIFAFVPVLRTSNPSHEPGVLRGTYVMLFIYVDHDEHTTLPNGKMNIIGEDGAAAKLSWTLCRDSVSCLPRLD